MPEDYRECGMSFLPLSQTSQLRVTELGNLGLDSLLLLSLGGLGGSVLLGLGLPLVLALLGALALGLLEGVLTDGSVGLGVEVLKTVSLQVVVEVLLELALVALLIVVGKSLHVLSNVATVDVLLQGLGVELLGLHVETGESVLGVRDEDTTVGSTLHDTEDAGTGGGAGKTNIEEGLEGSALLAVLLSSLGQGVLSIGLLDTGEGLVEAELLEDTSGKEQTSSVGSSPVGKTVLDAVGLKLVGVGSGEDLVTGDLRGNDLGDDVAVGEADNQAVLGRVVLVLGLGDQTLAGIVVGLSGSTALVLGLEAAATHVSIAIFGVFSIAETIAEIALGYYSPVVGTALDYLVERL